MNLAFFCVRGVIMRGALVRSGVFCVRGVISVVMCFCVRRSPNPATFTFILILFNLLMDNHLSPFPLDIPVFFGGMSSSILFIRWGGFFNSLFSFSISSIFFFPADGVTVIFF